MWSWIIAHGTDLIGGILALYEILARIVPSVKDWTIVGNIINVLKWISDKLNNRS